MAKKQTRTENPFEVYDFDFTNKVAYMFPQHWSQKEKMKFQAFTSAQKLKVCQDGGGCYIYNGKELRIMRIPPDVLTVPPTD